MYFVKLFPIWFGGIHVFLVSKRQSNQFQFFCVKSKSNFLNLVPTLPPHTLTKVEQGRIDDGILLIQIFIQKNLPLLFFYSLWKRFEGKSKDFKPTLHPCVAISVSQLFSSFQSTAVTATAGDELRLNNQRRADVTSTKVKTYFPPFIMEYFNFVVQKIKTFRT